MIYKRSIKITNLLFNDNSYYYDKWNFYVFKTPLNLGSVDLLSIDNIDVTNFKYYNVDGLNFDDTETEIGVDLLTWDLINTPMYIKDNVYAYVLLKGRYSADEVGAIKKYYTIGIEPNVNGEMNLLYKTIIESELSQLDNLDLHILGFNFNSYDSENPCPNYQENVYSSVNSPNINLNNIS